MSTQSETSEPAFPRPPASYERPDGYCYAEAQDGMTLRDYFAAKAMQSLFSAALARIDRREGRSGTDNDNVFGFGGEHLAGWANCAYDVADAMIAARKAVQP